RTAFRARAARSLPAEQRRDARAPAGRGALEPEIAEAQVEPIDLGAVAAQEAPGQLGARDVDGQAPEVPVVVAGEARIRRDRVEAVSAAADDDLHDAADRREALVAVVVSTEHERDAVLLEERPQHGPQLLLHRAGTREDRVVHRDAEPRL